MVNDISTTMMVFAASVAIQLNGIRWGALWLCGLDVWHE